MMANPPGISAMPDCWAVYPSIVCDEQGKKQGAAQQGESQHEHQQVRNAEGTVAEQVQIDDGILVPPFPDDDEDQRGHGRSA